MTSINLSIEPDRDTWLTETQDKITGERCVDAVQAEAEVAQAIEAAGKDLQLQEIDPSGLTLDLIAHAYDGVLQFGYWTIAPGPLLRADFLASVRELHPASIRLLGCFTAVLQGLDAMQHLENVIADTLGTPIPIFGTNDVLYADHFGPDGLNSRGEKLLLSSQGLPRKPIAPMAPVPPGPGGPLGDGPMVQPPNSSPPRTDPEESIPDGLPDELVERGFRQLRQLDVPSVPEILARLRPETLEQATRDWRYTSTNHYWPVERFPAKAWPLLIDQLIPQLATAPGLLAVPDAEVLVPVKGTSGEPRFHRATILFWGRFVRVYPEEYPEGVILRTRQVLRLDGGTPVSLPPRRGASSTSSAT
jgi:hypothetical protein